MIAALTLTALVIAQSSTNRWFLHDEPFAASRAAEQFIEDAAFSTTADQRSARALLNDARERSTRLMQVQTEALGDNTRSTRDAQGACNDWFEQSRALDGEFVAALESLLDDAGDKALRLAQRKHAFFKMRYFTMRPHTVGDPFAFVEQVDSECDVTLSEQYQRQWLELTEKFLKNYAAPYVVVVAQLADQETRSRASETNSQLIKEYARAMNDSMLACVDDLVNAGCLRARVLFLAQHYPGFLQSTPVDTAMMLLEKYDLLADDQRAAVNEAHEQYIVVREELRERFLTAQWRWDRPATRQRREQRIAEHQAGGEDWLDIMINLPGRDEMQRLFDLESTTISELRDIVESQDLTLPPALRFALSFPG